MLGVEQFDLEGLDLFPPSLGDGLAKSEHSRKSNKLEMTLL